MKSIDLKKYSDLLLAEETAEERRSPNIDEPAGKVEDTADESPKGSGDPHK